MAEVRHLDGEVVGEQKHHEFAVGGKSAKIAESMVVQNGAGKVVGIRLQDGQEVSLNTLEGLLSKEKSVPQVIDLEYLQELVQRYGIPQFHALTFNEGININTEQIFGKEWGRYYEKWPDPTTLTNPDLLKMYEALQRVAAGRTEERDYPPDDPKIKSENTEATRKKFYQQMAENAFGFLGLYRQEIEARKPKPLPPTMEERGI